MSSQPCIWNHVLTGMEHGQFAVAKGGGGDIYNLRRFNAVICYFFEIISVQELLILFYLFVNIFM